MPTLLFLTSGEIFRPDFYFFLSEFGQKVLWHKCQPGRSFGGGPLCFLHFPQNFWQRCQLLLWQKAES